MSANVNILLSIDGGSTFPFVLVINTPNDGNQIVTIPINVPATLQARVKVVSNNSLTSEFYDLSNGDFSISNGNCQVVNTLICPTNTITNVSGNAAFNLELGNTLVKKMIGNIKTFSTVNLSSFPVINYSNNSYSTCQISAWGQEKAVLVPFRVSQTGSFTILSTGDNGATSMVCSLFSSNTFNCANLINGNSFGAISWTSSRTITLNECTTYYLLFYNTSNPNTANNITINIQGVGSIYEIITSPSGVGYTYAALNQFNNQISAFSSSSNFTNLSGGTYSVYGL